MFFFKVVISLISWLTNSLLIRPLEVLSGIFYVFVLEKAPNPFRSVF